MSKKKIVKNFDLYDFDGAENDVNAELAADFMSVVLEATNNQTKMGLELTKLVVENGNKTNLTENEIYCIFNRAIKIVSDNHNLNEIFEKLGMS